MCRTVTLILMFLFIMSSESIASEKTSLAEKSLYSTGNTARLKNTMLKAKGCEKLVIGFIGGSITQGARATRADQAYVYHVANWWVKHFPDTEIKFINAGIGSTDSEIGAFRVQKHLLRYSPDFVIAEFAVNDPNTKEAAETLEGLTRQVLKSSKNPAMLYLFMCNVTNGSASVSAQEWHSKIGRHYGIPMISFGDAVWPEIESGRMRPEEIFDDGLHPNDLGHQYASDFIISFLNKIYSSFETPDQWKQDFKFPAPLISDHFEHTTFLQPGDIEPYINKGWMINADRRFQSAWNSHAKESMIGFEIEGAEISILYNRHTSAGIVNVKVDDLPEQTINAFNPSYPRPHAEKIFHGDKVSKHKVFIELSDKKDDKSNGHNFNLLGFMVVNEVID